MRVIDPSTTGGCVRLPSPGSGGAEHLLMALSTTAQVTTKGLSAGYKLSSQGPAVTTAVSSSVGGISAAEGTLPAALQFHDMLRRRGRALSELGAPVTPPSRSSASMTSTPPALGSRRTFQVCGDRDCSSFVSATATLRHIGPHGLLYVDNAAPANGYSTMDLDRLGRLFDSSLYPIDTTSFGRETDLDGNGAVIILLTPAVNHLSGNCDSTNSVILGFFFPDDLQPGSAGSNSGEIFYGLVPDPASSTCTIDRSFALRTIGPTFLHEFQHMISFGRHVVLAHGQSEDNWLDEGLSRLAEELGGREVPDSFCTPDSCSATYAFGDIVNAFTYLHKDTLEMSPLIEPGNVDGTLPDNGANWLFIRWLADHFSADSVLGTQLTRRLDGADSPAGIAVTGATNVDQATGSDFSSEVSQWQLANYLTSISGFPDPSGRLRYTSWDFASVFPATFGEGYPLQPDSVTTGPYQHSGMLLPGSGRHLRVIQSGPGAEVDVLLASPTGTQVDASMVPRIAVARVR
jgi:hypothetical protein